MSLGQYQCSRGNFDTMGPKPPPPATKETFEKRSRVLQELIDTEATFVSNLETLISKYIENFRVADSDIKKTFISNASIAVLFSNIQQIHTVNVDLLELLKRRILGHNKRNDIGERTADSTSPIDRQSPFIPSQSPPPIIENSIDAETPPIGDIFLQFASRFKLYAQYTAQHDKASKILQKFKADEEFQETLKQIMLEIENTRSSNSNRPQQNMDSYLIMPVQRVPRYKLLLKELHKYTPEGHSDRLALTEALGAIDSTPT